MKCAFFAINFKCRLRMYHFSSCRQFNFRRERVCVCAHARVINALRHSRFVGRSDVVMEGRRSGIAIFNFCARRRTTAGEGKISCKFWLMIFIYDTFFRCSMFDFHFSISFDYSTRRRCATFFPWYTHFDVLSVLRFIFGSVVVAFLIVRIFCRIDVAFFQCSFPSRYS